jgi:hypothetical protein
MTKTVDEFGDTVIELDLTDVNDVDHVIDLILDDLDGGVPEVCKVLLNYEGRQTGLTLIAEDLADNSRMRIKLSYSLLVLRDMIL